MNTEKNIKTEVAGTVYQIDIAIGQTVKADDVLIIIESMKMEIPIVAPAAGIVQRIAVVSGEQVKENQLIVTLQTVA